MHRLTNAMHTAGRYGIGEAWILRLGIPGLQSLVIIRPDTYRT